MKMTEARRLMLASAGYRVHFETRVNAMLESDFFPDRDEPPIVALADAWKLAEQWAAVNPTLYVNVYVIHAFDYTPVAGYVQRRLNTHPPEMAMPERS